MSESRQQRWTRRLSQATGWLGSFSAILFALGIVALWALSGPFFGFSDTWQLLINTPTTVITFWMAFVIQNTTNRESRAMNAKLDDLINHLEGTRNDLAGLEERPEEEVIKVQEEVRRSADSAEG